MKMTTSDNALKLIRENLPSKRSILSLLSSKAEDYFLSEDIKASTGFPSFDNSAMDGYVFHSSEIIDTTKIFPIQYDIIPGMKKVPVLKKGGCARITTGGNVPAGNMMIVPVEKVLETPQGIRIVSIPSKNPIRYKNEGYTKGKILLTKGTLVRPYELGILIGAGIKKVKVFDKIRINIINTGNELSDDNNTNGPVIYSILKSIPGVEVKLLKPVKDSLNLMKKRFIQPLSDSDILITTGGVSMGKFDFVYDAFIALGVDFFINKISQKPGKPIRIGKWKMGKGKSTLVCALPGNPVSSVFCTDLYVKYILSLLTGMTVNISLAISETEVINNSSLDMFCLGKTFYDGNKLKVRSEKEVQSHLFHKYFNTNCYVKIPSNSKIKRGNIVNIIKF